MSIAQLKILLERIPKTGAINQARRRLIIAQIYALAR